MIFGGCLCGLVRYQYAGELIEVVACHCQMCKRAQGGAFALNAPIPVNLFRFESGEESLKEYRHTEHKRRVFCGRCASPIFSQRDDAPEIIRLRLGSLDNQWLPEPTVHIHHDKAAVWVQFDDSHDLYGADKKDSG